MCIRDRLDPWTHGPIDHWIHQSSDSFPTPVWTLFSCVSVKALLSCLGVKVLFSYVGVKVLSFSVGVKSARDTRYLPPVKNALCDVTSLLAASGKCPLWPDWYATPAPPFQRSFYDVWNHKNVSRTKCTEHTPVESWVIDRTTFNCPAPQNVWRYWRQKMWTKRTLVCSHDRTP